MTQIKCLFMDDDNTRHLHFRLSHPEWRTSSAFSTKEAYQSMTNGTFDIVQLDHDLGEYDDQGVEQDGMTVVRWMIQHWIENPSKVKPTIVVHTWNEPRSISMVETLRDAGFDVRRERFRI